jgi:hypothetical protein
MEAPSSAREPHQVSRWPCRFAGSMSGTVARVYSSLDSPCNRLALVCRLRNIIADVVREPLNIISQLHENGRRTLTATNINGLLYWRTVHSADENCPLTRAMTYLMLTACAARGLLMCAQEVAPTPNASSARRSMRLADRPQPAGQLDARETRRRDDLALPQVHMVG